MIFQLSLFAALVVEMLSTNQLLYGWSDMYTLQAVHGLQLLAPVPAEAAELLSSATAEVNKVFLSWFAALAILALTAYG